MSYQPPSSNWLIASTGAAHAELLADMIVEGEIDPVNEAKPWLLPPVATGQVFTSGFENYRAVLAQPLKSRDSLRPTLQALYDLVKKESLEAPVAAEGRLWANLPADRLSNELNLCPDHVRRLYKVNPFRHVTKFIHGKKTTLIRLGHPSDLSPEDQARMMVKYWRSATGRKETREDFGCLVGIARHCPTGLGFDIFRTVVRNWSPFMAGVKIAQYMGQHYGDEFDPDPKNFYSRFFVFPSIKVIRRFIPIAVDYYDMAIQDMTSGPKCPDVCILILKVLNNHEVLPSSWSVDTKKKT